MKIARMFFVMMLIVGLGEVVSGDEGHNHPQADQQQPPKREQLRAAVQEICPVSGERLGEHGPPIKVSIGEQKQEVYFCCQACLKGEINPQHWAKIHSNFVSAQRNCPVMNKPLPQNPKWTIVDGQVIYICCPPCSKKLAADPEPYLRKIDGFYTASLQAMEPRR